LVAREYARGTVPVHTEVESPTPPGPVTCVKRPSPSNSYVVQYTVLPVAYGRDSLFSFPIGEHAHGAYSESTTDTVVDPFPFSTFIGRPRW
jgi:hypothetical protein